MIIHFLTRFSIYEPNLKVWKLNKNNNIDTYKKKLFDENRLRYRFENFRNICLPSILGQKYKNWKWHIGISQELPKKYQELLQNLCVDERINIINVNSVANFVEKCEQKEDNYATVRLDDDDGLNQNFGDKLYSYKNNNGSIISFPLGKKITLQNGRIRIGQNVNYPKIGLGLSAINFNIFNVGDHTLVDRKYNVIYDNTDEMYYLNCGEHTDNQRPFS